MKSKTLTCITAITLFAALALPVQLAAQHIASGTNGQITFTQGVLDFNGGAPANVFVANPDGSKPEQVPLPEGIRVEIFSGSVWSPDGTKLLISHTLRLDNAGQCCLFQPATVKPDGSEFNQLVPPTPPGGPSANGIDCWVWTLDQSRILCAFDDENAGAFSIRASDGGDPVRLTTDPGGQDLPTDISPDGTRFVFLRYKPGASPAPRPFQTQQVAIFVANIDGTGVRQITPYGLAHAHEFTSAQWSPDGTKIISETHGGRLFVVHLDGTGLRAIPLQVGTGQYFAFQPHWSPDGTRILFCMFINGGEGIYTANPDGSDVKQATFTTDFNNFFNGPDWGTHPLAP
jgi:Tol biopolymer transport system component